MALRYGRQDDNNESWPSPLLGAVDDVAVTPGEEMELAGRLYHSHRSLGESTTASLVCRHTWACRVMREWFLEVMSGKAVREGVKK